MHFYPGVAQYDDPDGSYRVFINEDTIRQMNPSFAGRPVFVEHVDEVDDDVNTLRNEADGWVIESFFNAADGKTWAKFIIVSDRGLAAVKKGYRLSNAYIPNLAETKATWNGVDYQRVVTGGEFEHLAVVQNPRYEESVIMTPDEFKAYNENLKTELIRLANSKEKKEKTKMGMKLNIFKRQKVENSKEVDFDGLIVELPKSKKEVSLVKVVEEYDKIMNMNGYANGDHMVKLHDDSEMSVNDLVKAHAAKCNEYDEMMNAAGEDGGEPGKGKDDINPGDVKENDVLSEDDMGEHSDDGDPSLDNDEDTKGEGKRDDNGDKSLDNEEEDDKDKKKKSVTNAAKVAAAKKIAEAKVKAARLKNAAALNARDEMETARLDLAEDQIARGKARYGSGN
jgi:hypothetical protein